MSAPTRADMDDRGSETPSMFPPTMYAPPWARDAATDAADTALAASEQLRRVLPPAPQLTDRTAQPRWRDPAPFDGDVAIRRMRERPSLDPVPVPAPPMREPGSAVGLLARIFGAVGLAALAAFFMVGTAPLSLAVKAQGEGAPTSFWSRFVIPAGNREQTPQGSGFSLAAAESAPAALADRFAAASPEAPLEPPIAAQAVKTAAVSPALAEAPPPSIRMLDREEIAMLVKRSEELIAQGDIAAARLMLTRAAEAGDARAALALGATYDSDVLRKLGVVGVAADAAQARAWYAKAAEFGSAEATWRLERIAQSAR